MTAAGAHQAQQNLIPRVYQSVHHTGPPGQAYLRSNAPNLRVWTDICILEDIFSLKPEAEGGHQRHPQADSAVAANQLGQVINWHNIISSTEPPPFNPPLLAEATRHEEHGDANLLGDDFDPLAGYENKDWVIVVLKKLYNLVQLPSSIALTNLELPGNIRPSTH
ncbi:hypothetical protein PTTG_07619 [Puccinia triticina 1-1 BBBD Race 1]|uniref:Uncharacterized protein n=1 Tax=Puccinia triticina (isolate 1-1 / race 1 (BBBD)) TaxID=630390 RepID=A0A0C4F3E0_PUCT1|nr:hypothetical protein PTTG_07619 [Puccinia triticina 1-1 BBBD Race 1]